MANLDRMVSGNFGDSMVGYRAPDMETTVNVAAHPATANNRIDLTIAGFNSRSETERYLSTREGERMMVDFLKRTHHEVSG